MAEMQSMKQLKPNRRLVKKTAEEYALKGMAAHISEHIIFDPKKQDLDTWLKNNMPSKVSRSDNIGWIVVYAGQDNFEMDEGDIVGLLTEWNRLKKSGSASSIDQQLILELGKRYKVVNGKWLFHVETGCKVDILWSTVSRSLQDGALSHVAHSAKVSPNEGEDYKHVICVYNEDYTNYDNVCRLEHALRQTGIKCKLRYKPDVFTHLGIYPNNEWGLRPTIYESQFDVLKRESTITELYPPVCHQTSLDLHPQEQ